MAKAARFKKRQLVKRSLPLPPFLSNLCPLSYFFPGRGEEECEKMEDGGEGKVKKNDDSKTCTRVCVPASVFWCLFLRVYPEYNIFSKLPKPVHIIIPS